jgi:hypothetical protein
VKVVEIFRTLLTFSITARANPANPVDLKHEELLPFGAAALENPNSPGSHGVLAPSDDLKTALSERS